MNEARVGPDGYIAQRMPFSINGKGHWLLTASTVGELWRAFSDEQVSDWPELVLKEGQQS